MSFGVVLIIPVVKGSNPKIKIVPSGAMKKRKQRTGKSRTWRFEGERKPKKDKQKRRSRELIRDGRFNNDELHTVDR